MANRETEKVSHSAAKKSWRGQPARTKIWIFLAFVSISCVRSSGVSDATATTATYDDVTTLISPTGSESLTVSATQTSCSGSPGCQGSPTSSTPALPSNCYHVCVCNSHVANVSYSMANMSSTSVSMTSSSLNTSSVSSSSSLSVSASPAASVSSSVISSYTVCDYVTTTRYASTVSPSLSASSSHASVSSSSSSSSSASVGGSTMSYNASSSSSVAPPSVNSGESCWVEIECMTTYSLSATPYSYTPGTVPNVPQTQRPQPSETDSFMSTTSYDVTATTTTLSTDSSSSVSQASQSSCTGSSDCYDVSHSTITTMTSYDVTTSIAPTTSAPLSVSPTDSSCPGSPGCVDSFMSTTSVTATTTTLSTDSSSSVSQASQSSCTGSPDCNDVSHSTITTTSYDVTTSIAPTTSAPLSVSATDNSCPGSPGCVDSFMSTTSYDVTATTTTLSTDSSSSVSQASPSSCTGSPDCNDVSHSTITTMTPYDVTTSIAPTTSTPLSVSPTDSSCPGSSGCVDVSHSTITTMTSYDVTTSIAPTTSAPLSVSATDSSCPGSPGCVESSGTTVIMTSHDVTTSIEQTTSASLAVSSTETPCPGSSECDESSSIMPTPASSLPVSSTVISCAGVLDCEGVCNGGKVYDACGVCHGDGSTCTEITSTEPQTIASSQPTVWVLGAGLDSGSETVCVLSDPESGDMVVNSTAIDRNLTHAKCEFQPWDNNVADIAGEYNLSVVIVHNNLPDVETNNSLPVYYYSSSDLSLTRVVPDEVVLDDLPKFVTLVGTGFFDWTETVCYFSSQASHQVTFISDTELRCRVNEVDTSTHFSASLSMDGGLVTVGSANLKVYASAPDVTEVKFSDTAAKILVEFDKDAETVDGDEACDNLFTTETLALLGNNPECSFSHSQELQITPGSGANITVGDDLVFKDDVIKALDEQYSKSLNGSFEVDQPDTPLIPTPVITGPDTIASCGNLSLSGAQSYGGGGRPLVYEWELAYPNSGQDFTAISNLLAGLNEDADRVNIPGTLFETGTTYKFTFTVTNFFNEQGQVNHSIAKSAQPVPALTLSSDIDLNVGEIFVSEELSIKANALVAPCANDTGVDFSWTVTCSDASAEQEVESSASFQATQDKATLRIDQGVLTADVNCTFSVNASMNYDPSVQSTTSQEITALPSPLQPAILGGDRQIGRESGTIKLDAMTQTVDPDQTNEPLNCSWSCETGGGGDCVSVDGGESIFASISGCETEVESSDFLAGATYVISVDVSKGSRSASASITLTVVDGNPPAVWVGQSMKVKSSDSVTLEGFYTTSTQPANVQWSSAPAQGFAVVDLSAYTPVTVFNPGNTSFVLLTLPEGLLTPGSKYRFKLTVDDGSAQGVASMDVEVRTGPTSGSFSVEPSSVQALDIVIMSAPQWTSDADSLPLQYAFGVLVEEDVCETFGVPSSEPEREQIMPQGSGQGYILPLCVVVSDKFDSFVIATVNITSTPPDASDLTPEALESLVDDAVQAPLQSGDVDAALGAVNSIMDTVQNSNNTSDELRSNVSQMIQNVLMQILDSAVIDEDIAFPLLTALVKTDAKATYNSSITAQAALTILQGLAYNPVSDNLADNFIKWLADLSEDTIDTDDNMKENVMEAMDKLADNMGADLKCGDPAREAHDSRLGSVKVQVSKLDTQIVSSSMSGAPKFDAGPALSGQYGAPRQCGGGKICCGVFLKLIHYKEKVIVADESKQDDAIDVIDSQVLGLELRDPISKELIEVQSLSDPLRLSFIITSVTSGKTVGCVYFEEQERIWVKTGLTAVGPTGDTLICTSTHATFFAPSYEPSDTVEEKSSIDYTPAIVGMVLGFLFGILAVLLIVGLLYWRHKKKITAELPIYDHRL